MPVREMFIYSHKPNNLFGIEGYEVPKKYCDPLKNIKERQYLKQTKGRKIKGKIPNKYFERKPQISPAPNTYNITKAWVPENKEKRSKSTMDKSRNLSKHSYIDQIFIEAKRIKSPGPGYYNPYKEMFSKNEVKGKQKNGADLEKPNFLCESEYIGALLPGPGEYNPKVIYI